MRLSHEWHRLLLFWAALVAVVGTVAVAFLLEVAATEDDPERVVTAQTAQAAPPQMVAWPVIMVTPAPVPDPTPSASEESEPAPEPPVISRPAPAAPLEILASGPQLQLRITRDSRRCPITPCYKWHLVKRHAKPPRDATIDLARLDLAPSLQSAVDKGEIDLFIEAIEHHRMVNGRDTVIFIATSLAGVTPNDGGL